MKKQTTLKDIGKIVGVSPRTVSSALTGTGRVSEAMRIKIKNIANEMNYKPNLQARGLVQNKSYLIGTVFPYLNVSFFNEIISGIEEKASEHGYDILLGNANLQTKKDGRIAIEKMIRRNVDGLICSPDYREVNLFKELKEKNIPTIQVMTSIDDLDVPFIGVDNKYGGKIATNHLISLGHEKIGFIGTDRSHYSEIEARNNGYLQALIESGIQLDIDKYSVKAPQTIEGGYQATLELLKKAPDLTAIFASTDYAALGVIRALLSMGKKIPEEVSVIGFDDLDFASHQFVYQLTTIAQPKREIGLLAFDMFLKILADDKVDDIILKPQLIIRTTTNQIQK